MLHYVSSGDSMRLVDNLVLVMSHDYIKNFYVRIYIYLYILISLYLFNKEGGLY